MNAGYLYTRKPNNREVIDEKSFIIFGGFVAGSRVNEAYICSKNGSTLDWKECGVNGSARPSPRAS